MCQASQPAAWIQRERGSGQVVAWRRAGVYAAQRSREIPPGFNDAYRCHGFSLARSGRRRQSGGSGIQAACSLGPPCVRRPAGVAAYGRGGGRGVAWRWVRVVGAGPGVRVAFTLKGNTLITQNRAPDRRARNREMGYSFTRYAVVAFVSGRVVPLVQICKHHRWGGRGGL